MSESRKPSMKKDITRRRKCFFHKKGLHIIDESAEQSGSLDEIRRGGK